MKIDELKSQKIWLCYKYNEEGKKIPISYKNTATGTDEKFRKTLCSYYEAKTAIKKYGFDGIGFVIPNGYGGIDIDKRDFEDDTTKDILSLYENTYVEKSPSGKGLHILFKVDLSKIPKNDDGTKLNEKYYQKNKKINIECYIGGLTNRFFTFTEDVLIDKPINDCTEQQLIFLDKYMLRETKIPTLLESDVIDMACTDVIKIIKTSEQAEKFSKLYFEGDISDYSGDDSSADMALCCILAFYCGEDFELIDKLFRSSKLYRKKWDRADYKYNTIKKAIELCGGKFYRDGINFRLLDKIKKLIPEKRYTYNDIGMSKLFADIYKPKIRYNVTAKQWYYYNGKVWKEDTGGMITLQKMKELSKVLIVYSATIENDTTRKNFVNYISKLGDSRVRDRIVKDSRDNMFISQTCFDKDTDLFNCQNGTFNLKTFEFKEHNPDDLLSKISNVVYNEEAKCPQFDVFMNQIMDTNKNKINYLQKAFGYSLTTDTSLETFFIFWGKTTRNGKGTLIKTILYMLGNYGNSSQPEVLSQNKNKDSSRPSGDIARLSECRFLSISEPSKHLIIDSALLKTLIGRDKITARHLKQSEFEFDPMFKLFINCNYLPIINDETVFESDRINVITFDRHFKEDERDLHLKDKLQKEEEISGIFNWCLEGLKMFREEGLIAPEEVKIATAEYEKSNDKFQIFFDEQLIESHKNITLADIYNRYKKWCKENGFTPQSKQIIKLKLKAKGIFIDSGTVDSITRSNVVVGYELKEDV